MRSSTFALSLSALLAHAILAGCAVAPAEPATLPERAEPGPTPSGSPAQAPQATPAPAAQPAAVSPSAQRSRATGTFEDARRHLVRGAAAIEMAKTDADLALAADEFQAATEISPEWAFAWMNLGQVQARLGRLQEAMASYKRYLALAPNDKDAARISDEIIKLEFRMEQASRIRNRGGIWVGEGGMPYLAKAEGNSLVLRTSRQGMSKGELEANEFWGGEAATPQREFRLELQGQKVTGTSSRSEVRVGKCMVPAEMVEVEGTYDEATGRLDLKVPRSRFQARTTINLFLDPVDCSGVSVLEKSVAEVVLFGPLPEGGIGLPVALDFPGYMAVGGRGWQGRLGLGALSPKDERALAVGLQPKDEILAIDGVEVKAMSPAEAVRRLRGAPGSEVVLRVLHKKAKEPVEIRVPRVKVPMPVIDKPAPEAWLN